MKKILVLVLLGLISICAYTVFGAESITVTRQVAGQTVTMTFTVGEAVIVAIGSGCSVVATILGFAKRRRVNVRFKGGQRGTVTQSALHKKDDSASAGKSSKKK